MTRLLVVSSTTTLAERLSDVHDVRTHPAHRLIEVGGPEAEEIVVLDVTDPHTARRTVLNLREHGHFAPVLVVTGHHPGWATFLASELPGPVATVPVPVTRTTVLAGIAELGSPAHTSFAPRPSSVRPEPVPDTPRTPVSPGPPAPRPAVTPSAGAPRFPGTEHPAPYAAPPAERISSPSPAHPTPADAAAPPSFPPSMTSSPSPLTNTPPPPPPVSLPSTPPSPPAPLPAASPSPASPPPMARNLAIPSDTESDDEADEEPLPVRTPGAAIAQDPLFASAVGITSTSDPDAPAEDHSRTEDFSWWAKDDKPILTISPEPDPEPSSVPGSTPGSERRGALPIPAPAGNARQGPHQQDRTLTLERSPSPALNPEPAGLSPQYDAVPASSVPVDPLVPPEQSAPGGSPMAAWSTDTAAPSGPAPEITPPPQLTAWPPASTLSPPTGPWTTGNPLPESVPATDQAPSAPAVPLSPGQAIDHTSPPRFPSSPPEMDAPAPWPTPAPWTPPQSPSPVPPADPFRFAGTPPTPPPPSPEQPRDWLDDFHEAPSTPFPDRPRGFDEIAPSAPAGGAPRKRGLFGRNRAETEQSRRRNRRSPAPRRVEAPPLSAMPPDPPLFPGFAAPPAPEHPALKQRTPHPDPFPGPSAAASPDPFSKPSADAPPGPFPGQLASASPGPSFTQGRPSLPAVPGQEAPAPRPSSGEDPTLREPQPVPDEVLAEVSTDRLVRALTTRSAELVGVSNAVGVLLNDIIDRAGADAAAALVPDGDRWRVVGGVGLRTAEHHLILDSGHWFIADIALAGQAILIEDTDTVRLRVEGAPLTGWRRLMAVPIPEARTTILLARGDHTEIFSDRDLAAIVGPVRRSAATLSDALAVRDLARALRPLQEF